MLLKQEMLPLDSVFVLVDCEEKRSPDCVRCLYAFIFIFSETVIVEEDSIRQPCIRSCVVSLRPMTALVFESDLGSSDRNSLSLAASSVTSA